MIAIGSLKTFLRVPVEIWSDIFRMVISNEFNEYAETRDTSSLWSAPQILAQVCASWRRMVISDAALWNAVTLHASEYWSLNQYQFFTHCLKHAVSPVTFVANLSPDLTWSVYLYNRWSSVKSRSEGAKSNLSERWSCVLSPSRSLLTDHILPTAS